MTPPLPAPAARRLVFAGCVNFITIGFTQSILGPSLNSIGGDFGIPASVVSLAVSALFLGAAAAILFTGVLARRFGYRRLLLGGLGTICAGALLMAVAHGWLLALGAAGLIGIGFGLQNAGTNLVAVRSFGIRAGPVVNLLSGLFGVGSVLGPLAVGFLLPAWRVPFLIVAGLALVAALPVFGISEPAAEEAPPDVPGGGLLLSVLGFVGIFFVYVSVEVGAASWEATHLTPHYGAERAAFFTSLFWAAIMAGRFLAIPLSARLRPQLLVLGTTALMVPAAALAFHPPAAPYAYMLLGLACAAVFPTTLVWVEQALPGRSETVIPVGMAAANLGPVLTAPLFGLGITGFGSGFVPAGLLVLALLLVLITGAVFRRLRSPLPAGDTALR